MLKWLHANGCPCDERVLINAADLKMLNWAHKNGAPLHVDTCLDAVDEGMDALTLLPLSVCSAVLCDSMFSLLLQLTHATQCRARYRSKHSTIRIVPIQTIHPVHCNNSHHGY